ncbi:hypothetical protein HELRODRAFT_186283 [Helobdella robusta]|uniref:FAM192A/Fyv6 N-terminal domain-containing protein n=1 Tax=Helobdella robusta TaxID=6412 RepID=T1FNW9_HELRO|nr:hypothetical protein HELRODRAFT_186283 [Helobdella robusta]ESO10263.1 hypothetical protein HELRODRAFT_186283 [Helobdella robusta]
MSISPSFSAQKVKTFVSESQIEEEKKKRQEEWERVRKPDQPLKVPEPPIDNRCLYDRLKEQRDKKQEDYEEEHKFKNQIRGLNSEETTFLSEVSQRQMEMAQEKIQEEKDLIQEFKEYKKVKPAKETSLSSKPMTSSSSTSSSTTSSAAAKSSLLSSSYQSQLLAGAVKRKKSTESPTVSKKFKDDKHEASLSTAANNQDSNVAGVLAAGDCKKDKADRASHTTDTTSATNGHRGCCPDKLTIVGYLPGLADYPSSDDSSNSSSSSESELDSSLLGKRGVTMKDVEKAYKNIRNNI